MRQYQATVVIQDNFSDSKDPKEAEEIPLEIVKKYLEDGDLGSHGLEIIETKEMRKLHD